MINRVKGFGGVKKKKNSVEIFSDGSVEKVVDSNNVVTAILPAKNPF